jgi:hypothetical protein
MQVAIATDGVEWAAADMTFLVNGLKTAILNRTTTWAGTGGVFAGWGGVVTSPSGLTLAISGPLRFHANGELGVIAAPSNVTATASITQYVIAVFATTDDTPAAYYGGGGPPNLHRNDTPTVIVRPAPAVLANGEVSLATVVAGGASITTITDTRIILPSVDASGNLVMGSAATVQGVNLPAHVALVGTSGAIGHLKLGAPGGAAAYSVLGGTWLMEQFVDVAATLAATTVLDDANFSAPPASSQPILTTGQAYTTEYVPTRQGDLIVNGYGPRVCTRYTLNFSSTGVQTVTILLTCWDTTVRVKANGITLTTQNAASGGAGLILTFSTVVGANTIQIYHGNVDGNQFYLNANCTVLATGTGVLFTG